MSSDLLVTTGLSAQVDASGGEILHGIDIRLGEGEVVAIMGPNGSGKSTLGHVLMGRPGYSVTAGSASLLGRDLLAMTTFERARAGLFLAHQYPVEVPGVPLDRALEAALRSRRPDGPALGTAGGGNGASPTTATALLEREAAAVGLERRFLDWPLNVDLSGGEKKRNEIVQIGVLRPKVAVLDEIDSGLDVDALQVVASRVIAGTREWGMGVLAITHYSRLLTWLPPDTVYVLAHGRIVDSGGAELATELEETGYAKYE